MELSAYFKSSVSFCGIVSYTLQQLTASGTHEPLYNVNVKYDASSGLMTISPVTQFVQTIVVSAISSSNK